LGLAALGLAAGASASPQEQEPASEPAAPAAHVDREGFPLPAEAVARVGSARLRHGGGPVDLDYSPDGSLLVSSGGGRVRVWDTSTGNLVWQFTAGHAGNARFSPDGKSVVVVEGSTCRWLDIRTGREMRHSAIKLLPEEHNGHLEARGGLLAVVSKQPPGKDLVVYELPSGRERFRRTVSRGLWFAFSPDGSVLAAIEASGDATKRDRVRLFATATGQPLGDFDAGDNLERPEFSPDGKKLVAHGSKGHVTVWGVPTGEVLHQFEVRAHELSTLAFTPDGKSVVACSWELDVVQVELSTGKELHRFRVNQPGYAALAFTADGKRLGVGTRDGWISQWDLATGRRLAASVDAVPQLHPLRFDATGRVLELWTADSLTGVDWRTGREAWRMPARDGRVDAGTVVSPRGSRLAGNDADQKMAVWDATSGNRLCVLPTNIHNWESLAFSPDDKTLYAADRFGMIHGWNVSAGKELPAFDKKRGFITRYLVVSPDGRWLAAAHNPPVAGGSRHEIMVWDRVAGGEPRRFLPRPDRMNTSAVAFSADGSQLAAVGGDLLRTEGEGFLAVWDVATGEEKFVRSTPEGYLTFVDYSADGRLLATLSGDKAIHLWEVATGQERHRFTGHENWPGRVAFSPDGRLVASSSPDAPIYVWDVEGCYGKPPLATPLTERDAQVLWDALDGADASAAFDAMRQLLARPGAAVALLRQRLRPAPAADAKTLRRLLDGLDADDFAAREKASQDLEALADRATPVLRKALAGNPSPETKRRIEHALEAAGPAAPQRRREVRAVEVLERLGTAGARELLQSLAGGDTEALLTREARSAAKRLN
jgi:WD40 repeat protein